MKKKPPSIFATFREMPQVYTASAVGFDAIRRVWLRPASFLLFYTPVILQKMTSDENNN